MKIIVYTICKNEIKNIVPWLENVKDADAIFVLDTGSIDGSYTTLLNMQKVYSNLYIEQKQYENFSL